MLCELMMRAIATGAVQPPAPSTSDGVKEVSCLTEDFINAVKSWITKYLQTLSFNKKVISYLLFTLHLTIEFFASKGKPF